MTRLDCILPSYPPLPPAQPSPALLCVSCTGSCFRGFNLQISILVLDTGYWWLGWVGCSFDVPLVVCSLHGVVMSWSDEAVIRLVVVFTQSEDRGNMMNNAPWLSKYGKGCRGENCGRGRQHGNWGMGLKVFTYRIVFFNIYNRQYLNSICIDKNFHHPRNL